MFRLSRFATVAMALVALPLAGASAQVTTMTFTGLGPNDYDPIPATYGSHANLSVTNRTRNAFGNGSLNTCGSATSHVEYWRNNYSNLTDIAFACFDGGVGDFLFQPLNGNSVTLNSLQLGSYSSTNGIGPVRNYTLRLYDMSFNQIFSATGTVSSTVTLNPNVSSNTGFYLQWGTDWDVGIDNITTTVVPAQTSAVPEPSTYALMTVGLGAMGLLARRRRRA